MSLLSNIIIENKFALANFILLNNDYCDINRDQLYVVQIIEQYQIQYSKSIDFIHLDDIISIDVNLFKSILTDLMQKEYITTKFVNINNINTMQYSTDGFWQYICNKFLEFEYQKNKDEKQNNLVEFVSNRFNRMLNPQEINQVEGLLDYYELNILEEIVNHCIILNSKYVATFVELTNSYKDAGFNTIEEIKHNFELMRS